MLTSRIQLTVTLQNDNFYYMRLPPFCKVQIWRFYYGKYIEIRVKIIRQRR